MSFQFISEGKLTFSNVYLSFVLMHCEMKICLICGSASKYIKQATGLEIELLLLS